MGWRASRRLACASFRACGRRCQGRKEVKEVGEEGDEERPQELRPVRRPGPLTRFLVEQFVGKEREEMGEEEARRRRA